MSVNTAPFSEEVLMADYFDSITAEQAALIQNAFMFLVATADPRLANSPNGAGPVNLSLKAGALHIMSPNRVVYLDYMGSGNETARHSQAGGPITVMLCSFEADEAATVRLYGKARITSLEEFPLARELPRDETLDLGPPRQAVDITVEKTMTNCGYGAPVLSLVRQRRRLDRGRRYRPKRTI